MRALVLVLKPQDSALPRLDTWWETVGQWGCADIKGYIQDHWSCAGQVCWGLAWSQNFLADRGGESCGRAAESGGTGLAPLVCLLQPGEAETSRLPMSVACSTGFFWFRLNQRLGLEFTWIPLVLWMRQDLVPTQSYSSISLNSSSLNPNNGATKEMISMTLTDHFWSGKKMVKRQGFADWGYLSSYKEPTPARTGSLSCLCFQDLEKTNRVVKDNSPMKVVGAIFLERLFSCSIICNMFFNLIFLLCIMKLSSVVAKNKDSCLSAWVQILALPFISSATLCKLPYMTVP